MNTKRSEGASLDRAYALEQLGRHAEAISVYQDLLGSPADGMIWGFIAMNYLALEKFQEAKHAAEMSLSLDPDDSAVLSQLAMAQSALGERKAAERTMQQALARNPDSAINFHIMAEMSIQARDYASARTYITEGLALDPDHQGLRQSQLYILAHENKVEHLQAQLNAMLTENPSEADLIAWKALILCAEKLYPKAEEMAIQALSIDPVNDKAKFALLLVNKNRNALLRFFVGKAFNTYKLKITPGLVIAILVFTKTVLIWGGFFVLYMLITWVGGVIYHTIARFNERLRLMLLTKQIRQSNYFLVNLIATGLLFTSYRVTGEPWLLKATLISVFALFTGISFFELTSSRKKIGFAVTTSILCLILWAFAGQELVIFVIVTVLVTILHGILFTFRVIGE